MTRTARVRKNRRPAAEDTGLTIRPGTRRDVPTIVAMIRGLAEYERLAHEVEITADRVRRHGFGARRYFHTLVYRRGRHPIGFALYFFTYSTFKAPEPLSRRPLRAAGRARSRRGQDAPQRSRRHRRV